MFNDPFFKRLAAVMASTIILLLIWSAVLQVQAQGGGYVVTDVMPVPGMVELDTKFWFIVNNAGVTEEWLMNMAGYVVWGIPGRSPDYLIARIDNLYPIESWVDPLARHPEYKPGIIPNWIPTDQLPQPTWFIWGDATLRVYVLGGSLPLE